MMLYLLIVTNIHERCVYTHATYMYAFLLIKNCIQENSCIHACMYVCISADQKLYPLKIQCRVIQGGAHIYSTNLIAYVPV